MKEGKRVLREGEMFQKGKHENEKKKEGVWKMWKNKIAQDKREGGAFFWYFHFLKKGKTGSKPSASKILIAPRGKDQALLFLLSPIRSHNTTSFFSL
jgi:hypothetical protein